MALGPLGLTGRENHATHHVGDLKRRGAGEVPWLGGKRRLQISQGAVRSSTGELYFESRCDLVHTSWLISERFLWRICAAVRGSGCRVTKVGWAGPAMALAKGRLHR